MTTTHRTIALIAIAALVACWCMPAASPHAAEAQTATRDRNSAAPQGPRGDGRIVPPNERRWTLGATVETLDTGVRVRSIVPRSAAERAGLERDDIIITVEGYQVGRVGNSVYPIEDELQRRADANGRVRLLVQDRRGNRLTNLDVRLDRESDRREGLIRGDVSMRGNERPPRDAELRLRLVRRNFLGKETVAEHTMRNIRSLPARFEFRYDMSKVDPDKSYEVEAEIVAGGRTWASEDGTYRIRPADPPADLRIQMRR